MILKCILVILCSLTVFGLEEGDPCIVAGELGVCRLLDDCEYALKLKIINDKKPVVCRWNYTRNMEVVCCPIAQPNIEWWRNHTYIRD